MKPRQAILAAVLVLFLIAIYLANPSILSSGAQTQTSPISVQVIPAATPPAQQGQTGSSLPPGAYEVATFLPAVQADGSGELVQVTVERTPGTGKVQVATGGANNPTLAPDTQQSIENAVEAARSLSGISGFDLTFYFNTTSIALGGSSAGTALAVASWAALTGTQLKPGVAITGTMSPTGQVGQVGGLLPKAQALEQAGFKQFIVPPGQSVVSEGEPNCAGLSQGATPCPIVATQVTISSQTGLQVVEVATLQQAVADADEGG